MRILISSGGTGGHVFPALAIAEALRAMVGEAGEIVFVGSRRGLESPWLASAGYRLYRLFVRPLPARFGPRSLAAWMAMGLGLAQSAWLVRRLRPQLVIGTGGYASACLLWVAARLGVPTHIHEMDAIPGRTNRVLAARATGVTTGFPETGARLGRPDALWTGNPVRREFFEAERDPARQALDLPSEARVLLAWGGSRGAARLNRAIVDAVPALVEERELFVFHITGADKFEEVTSAARGFPARARERYRAMPFLQEEMPLALAAADVGLSRAGASTVAELAAARLPAILVPYPHAMGGHQEANARFLETQGAATVILDADLTPQRLCERMNELLSDPEALGRTRQALAALARPEAAQQIARAALGAMER